MDGVAAHAPWEAAIASQGVRDRCCFDWMALLRMQDRNHGNMRTLRAAPDHAQGRCQVQHRPAREKFSMQLHTT